MEDTFPSANSRLLLYFFEAITQSSPLLSEDSSYRRTYWPHWLIAYSFFVFPKASIGFKYPFEYHVRFPPFIDPRLVGHKNTSFLIFFFPLIFDWITALDARPQRSLPVCIYIYIAQCNKARTPKKPDESQYVCVGIHTSSHTSSYTISLDRPDSWFVFISVPPSYVPST